MIISLLFLAAPGYAGIPYISYSYSEIYGYTSIQAPYVPEFLWSTFDGIQLKNPSDMRLGPDGNLYICDGGNNRIVVVSEDGGFIKSIGDKKTLKDPKGVFVSDNGHIYVADERGREIIVFSGDGQVVAQYGKPESPLFDENSLFKPNKVVVTSGGIMLINCTGNTNGLVQMIEAGNTGSFLGYFGANHSNTSLLTKIKKTFFSSAQLSRMPDVMPASITNIAIDDKDRVYTVSGTGDALNVKRLNAMGTNTLKLSVSAVNASAVAVSQNGLIFIAGKNGDIYEYTPDGYLLFTFGCSDNGEHRMGCFGTISAIAVNGKGTLYVLDESNGTVQSLKPTELSGFVHEAISLFMSGKYTESEELWREILKRNNTFSYAYRGLGEALYRMENYEDAMAAFELAGDKQGYSDAYWQVRNTRIRKALPLFFLVAVSVYAFYRAANALKKRRGEEKEQTRYPDRPFCRQISCARMMLLHPGDAIYGIQHEKGAGWLSSILFFLLFALSMIGEKYGSGFLFRAVKKGEYSFVRDILETVVVFIALGGCCYLICTIRDGLAKLKHLIFGFCYALIPVSIGNVLVMGLSNALTLNEYFFISFIRIVSLAWTCVLILLTILCMNQYSLKQTAVTVFLTFFTALVFAAVTFTLYLLFRNALGFFSEIWAEGVYRFAE